MQTNGQVTYILEMDEGDGCEDQVKGIQTLDRDHVRTRDML